jgi:hypothetical protein
MRSGKWVLDDNGEPRIEPDLIKWATWFENRNNRRVAFTELSNGGVVSTVFLALDHDFGMGRVQWETIQWTQEGEKIAAEFEIPYQPVLWETMVFNLDGEWDRYQERYRSRAEALAGHQRIVEEASKAPRREESE